MKGESKSRLQQFQSFRFKLSPPTELPSTGSFDATTNFTASLNTHTRARASSKSRQFLYSGKVSNLKKSFDLCFRNFQLESENFRKTRSLILKPAAAAPRTLIIEAPSRCFPKARTRPSLRKFSKTNRKPLALVLGTCTIVHILTKYACMRLPSISRVFPSRGAASETFSFG